MKRFFSTLLIASLLVCAMLLASCELFPSGEHTCEFEIEVIEPTCMERGYTIYRCKECENSYRDSFTEVDPDNHVELVETLKVEPTCTEDGYIIKTCTACGLEVTSQNGKAKKHSMEMWHTVKAPTCTESGIEARKCSNCDECYEERTINPTPTWEEGVVTAPTCDEDGYISYHCTVEGCTGEYVQFANKTNGLKATGHTYETDENGELVWVVITPATCEQEGVKHNYCVNEGCDAYHAATIEKHNYEVIVEEPTCTEYGKTYEKCTECGDSHLIWYTDPIGHKHETWTDVEGCPGIEESKCEHCGEVLQRTKEQ